MIRSLACLPLLLALVAACSPVPEEGDSGPLPSTAMKRDERRVVLAQALDTAREDCLLLVWSEQDERDVTYDRAHDQVDGGAISCATGTSPSQFRAAILAIREAARSGDKARMLEQIGMPLIYIDADGKRRPIEDRATIDSLFDEVFDARMIATLQNLSIEDMTVVPDQGAFFELGSLWLVVDRRGGRPSIVTVNRQALDDAARAARDKAVRNQATPLPPR